MPVIGVVYKVSNMFMKHTAIENDLIDTMPMWLPIIYVSSEPVRCNEYFVRA